MGFEGLTSIDCSVPFGANYAPESKNIVGLMSFLGMETQSCAEATFFFFSCYSSRLYS